MQLDTAVNSDRALERPHRWVALAELAVLAVLSGIVFLLVRGGITDDAYITLDYARNLAFHGHWGIIRDEVANSATSPLNVVLLAAGTAVTGRPVLALGVMFVAAHLIVAWALRRSARASGLPQWTGILGTALLLVNPLLLSAVGLEMTLASALLAALLLATVEQRPVLFGVSAGLLVLTRLDLGVFVLVMLLGRPALWRRWWKWLGPAAALSLPWFAVSWYFLGSAVPDTLLFKQLDKSWGIYTVGNGLLYYHSLYPVALDTAISAAVAAALALPVLLVRRVRGRGRRTYPWALLGLGGLAHLTAYAQLRVPPYHWYYAPSLIGLTILFGAVIGAASAPLRTRGRLPRLGAAAIVLVGLGALGAQAGATLANGTPWKQAAIMANWATPAQYARVGELLGDTIGAKTVQSPGEIGTLAYFCECRIVDQFSDRGYVAALLERRRAEVGALGKWLLDVNYLHFTPTAPRPADYELPWIRGPGPDPRWNLRSPWTGTTHLVLRDAGEP